MKLESYLQGRWQAGTAAGRPLVNPVSGETLATADATGLDVAAGLAFARAQGGSALRAMSFAERGNLLKAIADVLQARRESYDALARQNSGNTAGDAAIDIDGAIFTLKTYARIGKALGDRHLLVEPGQDQLAKEPVFFARHFWTTRPGVAVQINAFNFPAWGMWEKMAQSTLAGVPSLAKPATSTALLAEQMMRDVIAANSVPTGVLSLLCGSAEGLVEALGPMDSVAFTGSAATGMTLRQQVASMQAPPRLTIEADSVNATMLGPDVSPESPLFDLAVREVVKALTVKAGQLCTNIRRVLLPAQLADSFGQAVAKRMAALSVGDPAVAETRVGPLINKAQGDEARNNIAKLKQEADVVAELALGDGATAPAFVTPTLLRLRQTATAKAVHALEVFGPCATLVPYTDISEAVALAAKAEGSLALSLFSNDAATQAEVLSGLGPWHGRLLLVDEAAGKNHTGHAIVMPQCVHGGPGRAGGGEELGGARGLRFHMQRSAVQGSPQALEHLAAMATEHTL